MAKKHREDITPALKNIYLTGFMCSGKTAAGKILARRCGLPFRDSDARLKKDTGLSAAGFIRTKGLGAFRIAETEAVKELSSRGGQVVALGGGFYPSGIRAPLLRNTGVTVFINCPWRELEKRLRTARARRPLLDGPWDKAAARAKKLHSARLPFYLRADIVINASGLTPELTAEKIRAVLDKRSPRSPGRARRTLP